MRLALVNIEKIKARFGDKKTFIKALDDCRLVVKTPDDFMLSDIIIYYNNVFELNTCMAKDVVLLGDLARQNIENLIRINIFLKREVLTFLIELFTFNLEFVKEVRQLA